MSVIQYPGLRLGISPATPSARPLLKSHGSRRRPRAVTDGSRTTNYKSSRPGALIQRPGSSSLTAPSLFWMSWKNGPPTEFGLSRAPALVTDRRVTLSLSKLMRTVCICDIQRKKFILLDIINVHGGGLLKFTRGTKDSINFHYFYVKNIFLVQN